MAAKAIVGSIIVVVVLALVIAMTGGFAVDLPDARLSMRSTTNLFTVAWVLGIALVFVALRVTVSQRSALAVDRRTAAWCVVSCALVILPLAWGAADLWWQGDYVAPPALWRSAPPGADLATFVLGPPHHWLIGSAVRRAYAAMQIDRMESSGWLGLVGPVLAMIAVTRFRREPLVRVTGVVALVFLVWSLGAFLNIAGVNTGILLPQQLARFAPVIGNARMPARALIVVALAIALLGARWAREQPRHIRWGIVLLIFTEQLAAPLALAAVPARGLEARLAALPAGVVLNLPFGYRDGFGAYGGFDHTVMLGQAVHGKPIVGGFVARLPPRVYERYSRNATLDRASRVSAGESADPPTCPDAVRDLHALGVRYILARGAFTSWLAAVPLTAKAAEGDGTIYEVGGRCP
jgi:hypothetical protein